jgi:hypothetical protein
VESDTLPASCLLLLVAVVVSRCRIRLRLGSLLLRKHHALLGCVSHRFEGPEILGAVVADSNV